MTLLLKVGRDDDLEEIQGLMKAKSELQGAINDNQKIKLTNYKEKFILKTAS